MGKRAYTTVNDNRVLRQARTATRALMEQEGAIKADLVRKGISFSALSWFLDQDGNPTLIALNRLANAMGYELRVSFARLKAEDNSSDVVDLGQGEQGYS